MINPIELRIGNYVQKFYVITKEHLVYDMYQILCGAILDTNEYIFKGIPLTDDILVRCGFEKCDDYFLPNGVIKYSNRIMKLVENIDVFLVLDIDFHVEIKYLHQLQNLYFALTGEELTLNIET